MYLKNSFWQNSSQRTRLVPHRFTISPQARSNKRRFYLRRQPWRIYAGRIGACTDASIFKLKSEIRAKYHKNKFVVIYLFSFELIFFEKAYFRWDLGNWSQKLMLCAVQCSDCSAQGPWVRGTVRAPNFWAVGASYETILFGGPWLRNT